MRGAPSSATRTASSKLRRDAVRAPEVHARCRAGSSRARRRARRSPFTTSFSVPSPPTATTSGAPASTALPRELDQVARPLREERLARRARARARAVRELGPALARRAVVGRRVDEEDGAGRSESEVGDVAARACVIRSTAARSSSSLIRVNSPSTTMSLTVSRQPDSTPRSAADGEERRTPPSRPRARRASTSARTGRRPGCRRGRSRRSGRRAAPGPISFAMCTASWTSDHDAVGQCGSLRDEVHRGRVGRHRGQRDDQVAERVVRLQAAAGADADQLLAAELDRAPRRRSSRRGSPCPCPAPRPACPCRCRCSRAGRARRSAARRRRGRSRRCTSRAAGRRGGGPPRRTRRARRERGSAWRADSTDEGHSCRDRSSSRGSEQVLEFCAREPVERVFLEDVARRGLGRFVARRGRGRRARRRSATSGANLVPVRARAAAPSPTRRPKGARG